MQIQNPLPHHDMSTPDIYTYDVVFENDLLGMVFVNGERDEGAYVNGFYRERTKVLEAEDSIQIALRDRVTSIQGRSVKDLPFSKVLELLRSKKRPLRLTFERVQSSLTEENWKDALSDKHFQVLFKSFLKRKHLLLCHVWFSYVLEVNRCASLPESEREKAWNSLFRLYLQSDGKYSSYMHFESVPIFVSSDFDSFLQSSKLQLENRLFRLSWNGFLQSTEYGREACLMCRYQYVRLNMKQVLYSRHRANIFLAFLITRSLSSELALWMDIHYELFPLLKETGYPDDVDKMVEYCMSHPLIRDEVVHE